MFGYLCVAKRRHPAVDGVQKPRIFAEQRARQCRAGDINTGVCKSKAKDCAEGLGVYGGLQ